jgi:hypothetical protein
MTRKKSFKRLTLEQRQERKTVMVADPIFAAWLLRLKIQQRQLRREWRKRHDQKQDPKKT